MTDTVFNIFGIDNGSSKIVLSNCDNGYVKIITDTYNSHNIPNVVSFSHEPHQLRRFGHNADERKVITLTDDNITTHTKITMGDNVYDLPLYITKNMIMSYVTDIINTKHEEGMRKFILVPSHKTSQYETFFDIFGTKCILGANNTNDSVVKTISSTNALIMSYLERYQFSNMELMSSVYIDRNILIIDIAHNSTKLVLFQLVQKDYDVKITDIDLIIDDDIITGNNIELVLYGYLKNKINILYPEFFSDLDTIETRQKKLAKLKSEVSRAKHGLSTNNKIYMSFDDYGGEISIDISREEFESIPKIEHVCENLEMILLELKSKYDIDTIELVGGTSRIPAIKRIITNTYPQFTQTLNADECVSIGASTYGYYCSKSMSDNIPLIINHNRKVLHNIDIKYHEMSYNIFKKNTYVKTHYCGALDLNNETTDTKTVKIDYVDKFMLIVNDLSLIIKITDYNYYGINNNNNSEKHLYVYVAYNMIDMVDVLSINDGTNQLKFTVHIQDKLFNDATYKIKDLYSYFNGIETHIIQKEKDNLHKMKITNFIEQFYFDDNARIALIDKISSSPEFMDKKDDNIKKINDFYDFCRMFVEECKETQVDDTTEGIKKIEDDINLIKLIQKCY